MKKQKYILIAYAALIYILSGCISPFEPVGVEDMSGLLVVEGVILEEGTRITLSRTVKINESLTAGYLFEGVNYATIRIIDEAHNVVAVAEQSDYGQYTVNDRFSFVPGMKYALDIQVYWKHYQSAFVEPVYTPEIDSVNWKLNDDYSIDIMVSTHDPENKTLYCLWDFEENWELRSPNFSLFRYDPITQLVIPQSLFGDNRYYCWASARSRSFLLASTEKFRDAVIANHKIHTLQPGNSRYSYLYSINVSQYSLPREASEYFKNLQRNIDESGSLFAPQPSEMTGNIQCLSDPDEAVIGYIWPSKKTSSRLFIPMAELRLTHLEDQIRCEPMDFLTPSQAFSNGYGIYGESYVPRPCVDCTTRGFGNPTKTKPDFWPNDHR